MHVRMFEMGGAVGFVVDGSGGRMGAAVGFDVAPYSTVLGVRRRSCTCVNV